LTKLENQEEKRVQEGKGREALRKPLPTREVQGERNREMGKETQEIQRHKQTQADMRSIQ